MKKQQAYNKTLDYQMKMFKKIILSNKKMYQALVLLSDLGMDDYYIAAGAINQTVFNYYHNYKIDYGIEDYDLVYFDKDTSYEKEDETIKFIKRKLDGVDINLDIKNEARVHLWYEEKFHHKIAPYTSVEDAISKWGTTVTCIGVKIDHGKLLVYAPYGLNDLFGLTLRPVKQNFIKKDYQEKVQKWKNKWPLLKVIPWDD